MKTSILAGVGMFAAAIAGCNGVLQPGTHESEMNARLVQSIRDTGINNAIITQRTLYGYHFVPDSADLNELGNRDLAVLADHFRIRGGQLSIRRGGIPENLYQARLALVRKSLAGAGVKADRITIADAMPGGAGMPSEQVLRIIEGRNSPTEPLYSSGGGTGGGIGASSETSGGIFGRKAQ